MDQKIQTEEVTTVVDAPQQVTRTTTEVVPPVVKTEHPQKVYEKKKAIFRTYQIVWYVLAIIEILLAFRMTLKALGASQVSGFVNFVYALSEPLAGPFRGIFPQSGAGVSIIEWSTIVAAIVYAVIAYGIVHLIQIIKPVTRDEVEQTVDSA